MNPNPPYKWTKFDVFIDRSIAVVIVLWFLTLIVCEVFLTKANQKKFDKKAMERNLEN